MTAITLFKPAMPDAAVIAPYLAKIDETGWYSNGGPLLNDLEERMAAHFALPNGGVLAAANGTLALGAALMSRARPGKLCLMPAWTFAASAQAARLAGLEPLFADVDDATWALTPEIAVRACESHGEIAAVMPVSPFGAPLDLAAWDRFESEIGVPVVVDAAGGFDSVKPGKAPVVLSLSATKILGAGEGALILSQDPDGLGIIALRLNYGMVRGERTPAVTGLNGKMSEYHAAVALAALDHWARTRDRYTKAAQTYRDHLAAHNQVRLQTGFGQDWLSSILTLRLEPGRLDGVCRGLDEKEITWRQWWGKGCHKSAAFAASPCLDLAVTARLGAETLGLPFHAHLRQDEIERVCQSLSASHSGDHA